ncbi:MAG: energy transducer TonB [Burkholderiaceae bacterium]
MAAGADNEKASPPATGLVLRMPGALADADFFSRDALDVGPSPAAPVLIEFPSVPGVSGTHTGILSLFIDETGKVVRVRVESQAFPPEMREAARSAFMDAMFTPGLVDGLPVRSKIRVEVTFEAGSASR